MGATSAPTVWPACRQLPVLSGGLIHASATKALAMLGIGRAAVRTFARDEVRRIDLPALEQALRGLGGAPAIIVGNAGDVNAGEFDPLAALAGNGRGYSRLAPRRRRFRPVRARLTPRRSSRGGCRSRPLRSSPTATSGSTSHTTAASPSSATLPGQGVLARRGLREEEPEPTYGYLTPNPPSGPRALTVWAALRAWGRSGYREMVERHLDLAQRLTRLVDEAPDLERLADVPLQHRLFPLPPARRSR